MYTLENYFNQNGANEAISKLKSASNTLKARIKRNQTVKNVEILSQKLTNLFYPSKLDNSISDASSLFNQMLRQAFEEIAGQKIANADFSVGGAGYKYAKTPPKIVGSALHTASIQNLLNSIEQHTKNLISSNASIEEINNKINLLDADAQKAYSLIQSVLQEMGVNNINTLTLSASSGFGGYSRLSIQQAYNTLKAFDAGFKSGKALSKTDMGNILEYAIALLNEDLDFAEEATIQELINSISKKVKGSTMTSRSSYGSSFISARLNVDDLVRMGGKEMIKNTNNSYTFGGITLHHAASINPGAKKYGKIDVDLGDLRVSAKNWSDLTYTNFKTGITSLRSIGSASLVDAISRTSNALENYIWNMQDTRQGAPNAGHSLAKIALYTDIAMGFGNKKAANVLIINNRAAQEVYIIDMANEVLKALNGENSKFVLEGYEEGAIVNTARQLMEAVQRLPKEISQSGIYNTTMLDYLHSIRASILYRH